jgi:hypothetical protein
MWIIEIKTNGKVLRIDDNRNVMIKTNDNFKEVGKIKRKDWNKE